MARELRYWEFVKPKVSEEDDQKQTLYTALKSNGYFPGERFTNNCVVRANKTKNTLRKLMGSVELYSIMETDMEERDSDQVMRFAEALSKVQCSSWLYMQANNYSYEDIQSWQSDIDIVLRLFAIPSEVARIAMLKANFGELEFVSRLRNNLPKETKVLSNILTYMVKKHNLDSSIEKLIPSVIDTLGSNRKKQYIVILSTAPSAIYTASVSQYFNSCYDIRHGGHCYASSVSYLALDENTAILKVFEANEENMRLLNEGGIGALSSQEQALARRFVFFKKDESDEDSLLILGKAYPNEMQLEGSFFSKQLYKLFSKDRESSLDSYDLREHDYFKKIRYSNYFTGYKDLLEKGGMIAHKSSLSPEEVADKFNELKVAYNGICTVDTGDFVAYAPHGSNIGLFSYDGGEDDYDAFEIEDEY